MNQTKRLTGACGECGGPIEFQAELVGTMATCPCCRKQTELMLAAPPEEPGVPRKVIVWTVATAVVLISGLIVTVVGLKHFEKLAAQQRDREATATATAANAGAMPTGLSVSAISIEKGEGGKGTYVVGTVMNTSGRRRSHVAVEIELLDTEGQNVEIARALRPVLEPKGKWEIRVPVAGDSKAVSAKLASIREGP
jgi:hypothetical protein